MLKSAKKYKQMDEDFENLIPVINLQLSQGLTELRVRTAATTDDGGFTENRIERIKVQKPNEICVARPYIRSKPVYDVISLAVEDVKMAKNTANNCWQVFDQPFRKVLIYGKLEVHNISEFSDKRVYKFLVDDGTGSVVAFLKVTKKEEQRGLLESSFKHLIELHFQHFSIEPDGKAHDGEKQVEAATRSRHQHSWTFSTSRLARKSQAPKKHRTASKRGLKKHSSSTQKLRARTGE